VLELFTSFLLIAVELGATPFLPMRDEFIGR